MNNTYKSFVDWWRASKAKHITLIIETLEISCMFSSKVLHLSCHLFFLLSFLAFLYCSDVSWYFLLQFKRIANLRLFLWRERYNSWTQSCTILWEIATHGSRWKKTFKYSHSEKLVNANQQAALSIHCFIYFITYTNYTYYLFEKQSWDKKIR